MKKITIDKGCCYNIILGGMAQYNKYYSIIVLLAPLQVTGINSKILLIHSIQIAPSFTFYYYYIIIIIHEMII